MFGIEKLPALSSKGLRGNITNCEPKFENCRKTELDGKNYGALEFSLPKGSYATTVLREYMKTEPLKMS
ncbi:MAG: tRNA pseudouridine(13) synthase TruD [Methanolobus sp.]